MRTALILFVVSIPFALTLSCESDKVGLQNPECPTIVSFSAQIQPVILNNCATSGCHATAGPGKPALNTYSEISANASQIRNVIKKNPGDPQFMPLGGQKLADSTIQQFGCWIEQGTQDN